MLAGGAQFYIDKLIKLKALQGQVSGVADILAGKGAFGQVGKGGFGGKGGIEDYLGDGNGGGKGGGGGAKEKKKTAEDLMRDTLDIISKGTDALKKMNDFIAPTKEAMDTFAASLKETVLSFYGNLSGLGHILKNKAAEEYANVAKEAVDVIGSGVDALMKLHGYVPVSRSAMSVFSTNLRDAVADFYARMKEVSYALGEIGLSLFLKTAKETVELIGVAVDALGKLRGYAEPSGFRESLFVFSHNLRDAVVDFWHRMNEVRYILKDSASSQFNKTAKETIELISAGVDALMKLNSFKQPAAGSILSFSLSVRDAVADFWHRAQEIRYILADAAAPAFMASAKTAVEIIGAGVDAFKKLDDYKSPSRDSLWSLAQSLKETVEYFALAAEQIAADLMSPSLQKFTTAASAAVGVISSGVDALMKVRTYASPATESINRFVSDLRDTIFIFAQKASEIGAELENKAAPAFAELGQKIASAIGGAVDAFVKLKDYSGVPQQALEAVVNDIRLAIASMSNLASQFNLEGTKAVAEFATAANSILAPIKAAVDTFKDLKEYSAVAPETMAAIGWNIQLGIQTLADVAANTSQDAVSQANTFASSVSTIFGAIKNAVDVLKTLAEYENVPSDRMRALASDFQKAVELMQEMNWHAGMAVNGAIEWKNNIQTIADNIRAGVDIINALNGLSAISTIQVGLNVGSGGAVPDALSSQSLSMADMTGGQSYSSNTYSSNTTYNYNANYAAPPASPMVGFEIMTSLGS
jgi:hypothetical protein